MIEIKSAEQRVSEEPKADGKAFVVLSIGQIEQMLKAAKQDARLSSAHPGRAPKYFTRVIYADILGQEHNGSEGERHLNSISFMRSALEV